MEAWERKHITNNLPELMDITDFNIKVKAKLMAKNILSKEDVEILDVESERKGKTSASYKCYNILMTRTGAYRILLEILEEHKQSGAAEILKNGLRDFGIPTELDRFKDVEIVAQGSIRKLSDIFPTDKLDQARKLFEETIPELKFIDWFVKKQETFVLATSTIPSEPIIYIPRFLSNRIEIKESVFKVDCPDIFVFRNTIERWKLSVIVKPNWTDSSSSQLRHMTARFIYLDGFEDWNELKKKAEVPIHLIGYDPDQQNFVLEDSSGTLQNLSRIIGSQMERPYMSEDEFIQQQLSEDLKTSSVCICDQPGMGKTYLLANIARVMSKQCNETIIAFIQLSTFVTDFMLSSKDPTKGQEIAILNVFKYVAPSSVHVELLRRLVKAELLRVEIFFDGFDEIPSEKVEWMNQVFRWVKGGLPNIRIYITSRPHMRRELEKSLGVIAYDIMPFNQRNQIDYLVRFWSPNYSEIDQTLLKNYALNCVEEINKVLTKTDREMAGIPLLCRLIAEVYSKKVDLCTTTKAKHGDFPLKIAAMYQQFIQQRITKVTSNEDDAINIKLVHISYALKLLYPEGNFHNDGMFHRAKKVKIASSDVLNAGIMHIESSSKVEFIHRTFAEYFVAEYFSTKMQTQHKSFFGKLFKPKANTMLVSVLNQLFSTTHIYERGFLVCKFKNPVVASFIDFNLKGVRISDDMKDTVTDINSGKLLTILCACCLHNLFNLFALLKEVLTKRSENQEIRYIKNECYRLLGACIEVSTSQMFHSCIQLITEVLGFDVEQIALSVDPYDSSKRWDTLLHKAAYYANYEAIEYLIDRVPVKLYGVLWECVVRTSHHDVDEIKRRENILNLLHNKWPTFINKDVLTYERVHVNLIQALVKLGANLSAVDCFHNNIVMKATKEMSPIHFHQLVKFLLIDCKAEYLFFPNKNWKDPVPSFIENVELSPETMELLLNIAGININKKDKQGENLLFNAVRGNKLQNLEQLVNCGLDCNETSTDNQTLLHLAAEYGDRKMVRRFLQLKLDANAVDVFIRTPLHYAASNKKHSFSVVEILVENGANVQAKNDNDQTALHIAARNSHDLICHAIKYLIGNGVGVNDRDNDGNTPLHLCERKEVRNCLIEMGADIQAINEDGQTVLHTTASQYDVSCDEIKYLIRNGAGVNDCDNNGNTPLHLCRKKEARNCLIEMGADIYATNYNGQTVLHTTLIHFDKSCDEIKYLIRNGAGVNNRDTDGNTPLHLCEDWKIKDCLIEMGANIHATDKNGQTPAQKNPFFWKKSHI